MNRFLWIDLETTGIYENSCYILEVAAIVTDEKFNHLEVYSAVIGYKQTPHTVYLTLHQSAQVLTKSYEDIVLDTMNDWCKVSHVKSGLLDAVRKSQVTLNESQKDLVRLIEKYWAKDEKVILCGNSIHFDRKFIRKHLPEVEKLLHYRMIDISSIYEFLKGFCGVTLNKPEDNHRGLFDAQNSIDFAKSIKEIFPGSLT